MKLFLIVISFFTVFTSSAQSSKLKNSMYRAILYRKDSNEVAFNLRVATEKGKQVLYAINDVEQIRIPDLQIKGDSLLFNMPVFESSFRTRILRDGSLVGLWIKGTREEPQQWPFAAFPDQNFRFATSSGTAHKNLAGKWLVTFNNADGTTEKAIALFKQEKNKLSGTFLTNTGDYRYLDGIVTNDSMKMSTFDGGHAYLFTAKIDDPNTISGGVYYFGPAGSQQWSAVKDEHAALPLQDAPCTLRKGEAGLNFAFNDLQDRRVSLKDERYNNKVVIVEVMGSWCPNCMDETKFLSEFYQKNKSRGVEVIALAYEYSTDLARSKASLGKFRDKYHVKYPVLITGITAADEQLTEKTLPQLTPVRSFPTTIILDKKGNVREVQSVFYGPGTGLYYQDFTKSFNKLIDQLLAEK